MAANTCKPINIFENVPRNDRNLMNKLRDSGLEYVSTSGKLIPAKIQPDVFCHCPQKCKAKLTQDEWDTLFYQFYRLADQNKQNMLLQSHIVIKAVHLHNWESDKTSPANKRRVTCKYHVPDLSDGSTLMEHVLERDEDSIEVCQKAFMNCYGITEKRVRMQRERCISRLAPDHYKNSPFGKKKSKTESPIRNDEEIKIKDTLEFSNGLEITPVVNGDKQGKTQEPLDLSHDTCKQQQQLNNSMEVNQTKINELARQIGVSRERIQREMTQKYEQMMKQNMKKQHGIDLAKKRKTAEEKQDEIVIEVENCSPKSLKAITEQVVGLDDDFTILPIQTLNNGDLTITPVLGEVSKPVENGDIMRVNYFFQNQLWKPELIGLANWKKFQIQSEY